MSADGMKQFGLLCQQVAGEPSLLIKTEILSGFLTRYKGDVGLLLKLLLPKYAGRVYCAQEKQLLRALASVVNVSEDQLRNVMNSNGCIGETAKLFFRVVAPRDKDGWCGMTVPQFDGFLDRMANASTEAARIAVISDLFNVSCVNVVYLFFRELKLDLRLGAGLRVVLSSLHPKAYEVFQHCADVQEVVRRIQNQGTRSSSLVRHRDGSHDGALLSTASPVLTSPPVAVGNGAGCALSSIQVGIPLAPMLASPARSVEQVLDKCPNGAFSEVKYDGERIQIHKNGNKMTFFARSLKPMAASKYAGLEPFILQAIQAESCVLDGEIVMVDMATSTPLPFGTLGKHKRTEFATACPCVFLFDILYKNGTALLTTPLLKRRELMKECVQAVRNRVMYSELSLVTGTREQQRAIVHQHLNLAIAEGLEGLVLKDLKSVYEPRARHWIKIKRDYLSGLADSADLVVLGAWYGSGSKGGQLSSFLVGCVDTSVAPGEAGRYKTVCKVGNGLDDNAITSITIAYKNRMSPSQGGLPKWLHCHSSHVPDLVAIRPEDADVMEIIGAEFSTTKTHTSGISVRFPRILRIRHDKTVENATTLQELMELFRTSKSLVINAGVAPQLQLVDSYTVLDRREEDSAGGLPPLSVSPTVSRSHSMPTTVENSPSASPAAPLVLDSAMSCGRGVVNYVVSGDAINPTVSHTENVVVFHSVAVRRRWSTRGFMGRLTEAFGDVPQKSCDGVAFTSNLGDVAFSEVGPASRSGRVFLASAFVQHGDACVGVPPVDGAAFVAALKNAAAYAQQNDASLHVVLPHVQAGLDVPLVKERIGELCCESRISITVYGSSEAAAPPAAVASFPAVAEEDVREAEADFERLRRPLYSLMTDVVAQLLFQASSKKEAMEVHAKLELMGGCCVSFGNTYNPHFFCTHVIVVSDAQQAIPLQGRGGIRAQWVHDCFAQQARYAEDLYQFLDTPPRAPVLGGCALLFSAHLLANGTAASRVAKLLGAVVHPSWQLMGRRTELAVTDVWDSSCTAVRRLGGPVVYVEWLLDCAVAQKKLPLDAYIFSLVNKNTAGKGVEALRGVKLYIGDADQCSPEVRESIVYLAVDVLGATLTSTAADAQFVVRLHCCCGRLDQGGEGHGKPCKSTESQLSVRWLSACATAGRCAPTTAYIVNSKLHVDGAELNIDHSSRSTSTETYVEAEDISAED